MRSLNLSMPWIEGSSPFAPTIDKPYWVRAAVRMKSGSRFCGCPLRFATRKTAPPLTTCGGQNLRAKEKRSGTQPDTLLAMTPRTLPDSMSRGRDEETYSLCRLSNRLWSVSGPLLLSLIVPLANDNGQWKVLGALGAFALSIVTFNAIGSLVLEPLFLTRLERWANAAPYSAGLGSQYPENCDALKQRILARDSFRCGNCGSSAHLHVHHIVPLSLGGSNEPTNLRTLCESCHKKMHAHMRD